MRENFYFIVIYIQTYVYGNLLYFLQLMCMTSCICDNTRANFVFMTTYKCFWENLYLYVWQLIYVYCSNLFNNIKLKFSHKLLLVQNVFKIYASEI